MPKSIVDVINFFYSKNFLVFLEKNFKLPTDFLDNDSIILKREETF